MSDGEQLSVEDKARQLGWADKDAWKGPEDHWVDAEEFVRRGEAIMPILKKNNETMHQTIARQQAQLDAMATKISAAEDSMKAMEELHAADVKRQVQRAKEEIRASIRTARENGDTDAEMQLMDQLTEVNGQLKELEQAPAAKPVSAAPAPKVDPATQAWLEANPWFQADPQGRKASLAVGISNEFAKAGRPLDASFYADLDKELAEVFGNGRREAPSKVEGTRSEQSGGSKTGYGALPSDAKAECDKDVKRFVGEGRRFKDVESYRAYYAKLYFSEE